MPGREQFDIGIPELSRVLVRRQDLGEIIAGLDLSTLEFMQLQPAPPSLGETMRFEGYDVLTHQKELERDYSLPEVQTPQEVIAFYAREIAAQIKAPEQFHAVAAKLSQFFNRYAFGGEFELDRPGYLQTMAARETAELVIPLFRDALRPHLLQHQDVRLEAPARSLYTTPPFPWSRPVYEADPSIFNLQACDNEYERRFAQWLDRADDCIAFAKLPRDFGFAIEYADVAGNLRLYYPDFVALDTSSGHWLIETKGQEDFNATLKDAAATLWYENATLLGLGNWRYVKVREKDFDASAPLTVAGLPRIGQAALGGG